MSASAASSPNVPTPLPRTVQVAGVRVGLLEGLLLATVAVCTWTKLYWEPLGKITLAHVLAITYVVSYAVDRVGARDARVPRRVAMYAGLVGAMVVVWAAGFVSIETFEGRAQFWKAFLAYGLQATVGLVAALHVARGGMALLRLVVFGLVGGMAVNGAYGLLQLVVTDLDARFLRPLPFSDDGAKGILNYGGGLYRINGLMRDPNHLGVVLAAPIPLVLTWTRGYWRVALTTLLGLALLLTLSRSGLVALFAALLVLAVPMRGRLLRPAIVVPVVVLVGGAVVGSLVLAQVDPQLARSLIFGRFDLSANSVQVHLRLYELVPGFLQERPLFGHGLNSFALLFEGVSGGREGFGPHSTFIRLLVENGLVGLTLAAGTWAWLMAGLVRVRDMRAWGLAAAVFGMLAGNVFYLTTQIMYAELLYGLAAAAPVAMAVGYNRRMPSSIDSPLMPPRAHASTSLASPDGGDDVARGGRPGMGVRGAMHYWWVVLAAIVVAVLASLLTGGDTDTQYQATATVYIGQPVSANGQSLLGTVGSKAATVLEFGQSDEAVAAAAKAADTTPAKVREGLSVAAVQTKLASKLAVAPTLMKVRMVSTDRDVAQQASATVAKFLVDETNPYADERLSALEQEVASKQRQVTQLERDRTAAIEALNASSGSSNADVITLLVRQYSSDLESARGDLLDAQGRLSTSGEVEKSRIVTEPNASKLAQPSRGPALVMAAFVGLVVGLALALLLNAVRGPRSA